MLQKTENDLNHRELQLMQAHQHTMDHGKQTLELKQDLAKKQVQNIRHIIIKYDKYHMLHITELSRV